MKSKYGLDYVDVVTEAGPDGIVASRNVMRMASIKSRVEISVRKHGSGVVAIVGHHGCAAGPLSRDEHFRRLKESVGVIKRWGLPVEVVALWVNEDWQVEQVDVK